MTRKKKEENKIEFWRGRWTYPKNFPEEYFGLLNERFDVIDAWVVDRRKQGPPFNEQFCADVYYIAEHMTRDNSFNGNFDPEALYQEMCKTMKIMRKEKKGYSLFDEAKMLEKIVENNRKKI